jgi:ankyrin repeat protein
VQLRLEEVDCNSVHEAVRKDHSACLKLLLAKEPAAALQLDEHGETPLHCIDHSTAPHCHAVTAALLSAQPATAVAAVINAADRQQHTALHRVVYQSSGKQSQQEVCQQCLKALCAAGADARIDGVPTVSTSSYRGCSSTGGSLAEAVLVAGTTEHRGSAEEQRRSSAAAVARITASLRALQQGGLDVNDDACYLHMCAVRESTDAVTALLACGADVHKGACS